jgi:RNA 2',3'-cyclic 3'-phosphodiesterase
VGPDGDAPRVRLFVGFGLPVEAIRAVEAAIAPWRDAFPGARWSPTSNWHVTLAFLGWIDAAREASVHDAVRSVAMMHRPVATRLSGLGAFPSARRARVLWAGVADPERRVAAIASGVNEALGIDVRPPGRGFTAHLTVARADPPVSLAEHLADRSPEPVAFEVARLVLFRSHLGRPAPRYEPLAAFPLGG